MNTLGAVTAHGDAYAVRPISVVVTSVKVPGLVDPSSVCDSSQRQSGETRRVRAFGGPGEESDSARNSGKSGGFSARCPRFRVSVYPQEADAGEPYRVRVELQRFEGAPGYEALTAAYSKALGDVSRDIATAIHASLSK